VESEPDPAEHIQTVDGVRRGMRVRVEGRPLRCVEEPEIFSLELREAFRSLRQE
jgi:hypothetical protein